MSARRAAVALVALGACAPGALPAAAGTAPRSATVRIVDNAFVRGVQRPVVRVRVGGRVTWRWSSQQSHGVLVRSGPERFASAIRNHGTFAHRFARPGTYRIVCALHAPGMRMTVRVVR